MLGTNLAELGRWLHGVDPILPMIAWFLSIVILFGCAVTSWLAPSEKKDRLFHREVM